MANQLATPKGQRYQELNMARHASARDKTKARGRDQTCRPNMFIAVRSLVSAVFILSIYAVASAVAHLRQATAALHRRARASPSLRRGGVPLALRSVACSSAGPARRHSELRSAGRRQAQRHQGMDRKVLNPFGVPGRHGSVLAHAPHRDPPRAPKPPAGPPHEHTIMWPPATGPRNTLKGAELPQNRGLDQAQRVADTAEHRQVRTTLRADLRRNASGQGGGVGGSVGADVSNPAAC